MGQPGLRGGGYFRMRRQDVGIAIWVGERPKARDAKQEKRRDRKPRRMGMDITWVTDRIGVGGGIWTAPNMELVAREGITHIIDMQIEFDDTPLAVQHGIRVLWNPTDDDFEMKPVDLFERGVEFAQTAMEADASKLYIHCAAGVHRAPMMTLAILASMGWNLDHAMEMIEGKRPVADFADVYVKSVERFLEERS